MKTEELTTIEHLSNFLEGTQAVAFTISSDKDKRYRWLQRELVRFDYLSLNKPDKGIVIRYLLKVTGYSRQQLILLCHISPPLRRQDSVAACRRRCRS